MKEINNIYIYGISGLYNYGCEAMVRSISEELRLRFPKSTITYITYSYSKDIEILKDCKTVKLQEAKYKYNNNSLLSIVPRGFRRMKKIINVARAEDYVSIETEWAKQCDLLIIIGGDVFDLPAETRETAKYENERIYVSKIVRKYGGKVILWGISFGSFESNPQAKSILFSYLKNDVNYIVVRDQKSYSYLIQNNVHSVEMFSDPAYIQRTIQTNSEKKDILGINLSLLANRYLDLNLDKDEWVERWSSIIYLLYKELGYKEVYLIPHVVNTENLLDDDYYCLNCIASKLISKKINVTLAPPNIGFMKVKEYLIKCDILLAARMHCAINAITCGVPTIFISYSEKSIGMCKHVYNDLRYVIDIKRILTDFDDVKGEIKEICQETNSIRRFLAKRNTELYDDAKESSEVIIKNLEERDRIE